MQFKPFKMEIDQELGSFDGEVMHLGKDIKTDKIVYHHEIVHGFLSSSTPDGVVLNVLKKMYDEKPNDAILRHLYLKFRNGSEVG